MAGVNNPPNLKPLIDNQSTAQSSELTAAEQAIGAKVDAAKVSLEAKASQTKQTVNDESTLIKSAIAQSVVDSEAATNAARDLVTSELNQSKTALELKVLELKGLMLGAEYGSLNPNVDLSYSSSVGYHANRWVVSVEGADANALFYSRPGAGYIDFISGDDDLDILLEVDGVEMHLEHAIVPSGSVKNIKYFESIVIRATNNGGFTRALTFSDWALT